MDSFTDKVQRLAYVLWENAGCPAGRSDEFWFAAEAQLAQSSDESAVKDAEIVEQEAAPEAPVSDESTPGEAPQHASDAASEETN